MTCLSFLRLLVFLAAVSCFLQVSGIAQGLDVTDGENDPIKLFERGQNAHSKGEVLRALEFYEAALKLRPEFPEAEYQRGTALVSLNRPVDAERAFRRAIEMRQDWPLPYRALGSLLARADRDKEAEPLLRKAIQLGVSDSATLDALSTVRFRAGDKSEALTLARRACDDPEASAFAWTWRGFVERLTGDPNAAMASLERALKLEPNYAPALKERGELYLDKGDYEHAIADLKAASTINPHDREISMRLARAYQLGNHPEEMRQVYESIGVAVDGPSVAKGAQSKDTIDVIGSPAEVEAANNEDPKIALPALEKLIAANPGNAALLGKLGEITRRSDPQKSAESYRKANEIDATNPKYAIGYAAALVQLRKFAEAAALLRRVISSAPNEHAAHANLAIALYELKDFAGAITEYEWLASTRPDVAATYFFLATAHDNLGQYEQALNNYEKFLSRADPTNSKLDIEKVNLRLPTLRDQIKRGQGKKQKKP